MPIEKRKGFIIVVAIADFVGFCLVFDDVKEDGDDIFGKDADLCLFKEEKWALFLFSQRDIMLGTFLAKVPGLGGWRGGNSTALLRFHMPSPNTHS